MLKIKRKKHQSIPKGSAAHIEKLNNKKYKERKRSLITDE